MKYTEQLMASGKFIGGTPLHPTAAAASNGQTLKTDGPFAETREQVGGYALIEARDREEAIAIAGGFLGPESPGAIEVRAVAEMQGVPTH